MKLEVKKDRLEINKIIERCLPLMIKNKNMTQECADCIVLYFIEKTNASLGEPNVATGSQNHGDKKPTGYDVKNNIIRELTDEEIKQDCKDSNCV